MAANKTIPDDEIREILNELFPVTDKTSEREKATIDKITTNSTDGACDRLNLRGRNHAFLIPAGNRLPFTARGPVFRLK